MSFRSPSLILARHETRSVFTRGPVSFVHDGRFHLGAIMREAVKVARTLRAGGSSWSWRMRIALRHVWGRAKVEMAAAKAEPAQRHPHHEGALPRTVLAPRRTASRQWDRPIRVRLHGW